MVSSRRNKVIAESVSMSGTGLNRYCVTLITKPSKTVIAILRPMASVNRSIPLISPIFGNIAAISAYPGRNSNIISEKGILSEVVLNGSTRTKIVHRPTSRAIAIRSIWYFNLQSAIGYDLSVVILYQYGT